jgi:DNA-binding response OmpR family regulator
MYRILIADDERKLREAMRDYMAAKGFEVDLAGDGQEAVEMVWNKSYDLVILDVMMPVLNGFEACREIRREFRMPILFLSALGEEEDQLNGFISGADDYIVKPFPLAVLVHKCEAMIRRDCGANSEGELSAAGITLGMATGRVSVGDAELVLSAKDLALLEYLMRNKGQTLTREQILCNVWGYEFDGDDRVVDTHIKRIRKALGDKADCITTVIGMGYRLEEA